MVITGLVAIHFAAAAWHGGAHSELAIALPPEKNAFVYIVILIAPIVAASLSWSGGALRGILSWLTSWNHRGVAWRR